VISVNLCFIGLFLATIIEWTSALDFYSDIIVAGELADSTDIAWLAFTIFTIVAPYYTIYSSLISYLQKLIRKKEKSGQNISRTIMNFLIILPSMLLFLILIDITYIVVQVLVLPVLLPLSIFKKGEYLVQKFESFKNAVFYKVFGLSHMEIEGFRSQRTILQF